MHLFLVQSQGLMTPSKASGEDNNSHDAEALADEEEAAEEDGGTPDSPVRTKHFLEGSTPTLLLRSPDGL